MVRENFVGMGGGRGPWRDEFPPLGECCNMHGTVLHECVWEGLGIGSFCACT